METLLFKNPELRPGCNVTVRAGDQWYNRINAGAVVRIVETGKDDDPTIAYAEIVDVRLCSIEELPAGWLHLEHDKTCRNVEGLTKAMDAAYGTSWDPSTLTVIMFIPYCPKLPSNY